MKTKKLLLTAAIIIVFVFCKGYNDPVYEVSASEAQPAIIMQQPTGQTMQASEAAEEVVTANSITMENKLSGVVDVASVREMTAAQVESMIDEYFIPDAAIYLDGELREEGDLDHIINRRNVAAIEDPIQLGYGVLIKNTAVRTYPSWQKLSAEADEDAADYFQKSVFLIGEGVVVLHKTEDGIWSFVQGMNESGWVETANIAFCRREEMDAFANAPNFVIVTEEILLVGNQEFRMGTRLPLSRIEGESVVVWLPASNDNGNLYQTEFRMNLSGGLHVGNLELNVDNVMKQAYKLINVGYACGDAQGLWDEGSMLTSIYRCFGIVLPRDTENLMHVGAATTNIKDMDMQKKREFIIEQGPGTILQMEEHAVLYLGLSAEGKPMILQNVEKYSMDGINAAEVNKCVVTPLETYTADGNNYLECYQYLIDFKLPGLE